MTKPKTDIGRKIRAARLDRNVNQKDLSDKLIKKGIGIYPANLCRIEQGTDDPTWSTVHLIADLLQMAPAELVAYDDETTERRTQHDAFSEKALKQPARRRA